MWSRAGPAAGSALAKRSSGLAIGVGGSGVAGGALPQLDARQAALAVLARYDAESSAAATTSAAQAGDGAEASGTRSPGLVATASARRSRRATKRIEELEGQLAASSRRAVLLGCWGAFSPSSSRLQRL